MYIKLNNEGQTKKFNRHWDFCVGSGHAQMALRADYAQQLKYTREELGIKFVRFHGILNDDMHTFDDFTDVLNVWENGKYITEQNFYLCGVAYDNILACGMKPFVELSFIPRNLAGDHSAPKGFYGSNMSHPADVSKWAEHISKFVKYLLHRYGSKEVETWFFEVWNEPDLKGAFYHGTQEDYFELYEATARAIKAINPKLQVGGPATSGSKWVDDFVDYCERTDTPVDFISTHQYSGDPLTGVSDKKNKSKPKDKSKQVKEMFAKFENQIPKEASILDVTRLMFGDPTEQKDLEKNVFKKNSSKVKEQAKGLPVYYTEWNLQATFSSRSNDTRKAAAYNIKTILDVEENVVGTSIWTFSDIFEEMHQFKEEFHGGFGMQTIHGIPKPSFHALKLMSLLGEERYILEENATDQEVGYALFKKDNLRQILLFRQNMKQLDVPKENVKIEFACTVKPKSIKLIRIDEEHGNPLRIWEDEGKLDNLTPIQVELIKEKSALKYENVDFKYIDNKLYIDFDIDINDVYYIEIDQ